MDGVYKCPDCELLSETFAFLLVNRVLDEGSRRQMISLEVEGKIVEGWNLQMKLNTDGVEEMHRSWFFFSSLLLLHVNSVFREGLRPLMMSREVESGLLRVGSYK